VVRYREAGGEHYVYRVDVMRNRLVGYTVFNRLIEVNRRADRYVRARHSRYAPPCQGRGFATTVSQWRLDAGLCLLSGARQSEGAHALWLSLARSYDTRYVQVQGKRLTYPGDMVPASMRDDLHTRMLMLGQGWTLPQVAQATGMRLP
jgi:hypothetical protein